VHEYYTYILASHSRRLYVGVTNDLVKRLWEHRSATTGFAFRYRITRLVHFEMYSHVINAIQREKQIKGWLRWKKIALVEVNNPTWDDLAAGWFDQPNGKST